MTWNLGALAKAPQALVGVNISNPQWVERPQQEATLAALVAAGVRVIRVPLTPTAKDDYSPSLDFIERAFAKGIGTHLVVWPQYALGAVPRPAHRGAVDDWAQEGLSSIDPRLTGEKFRSSLERLEASGVALAAIEFGNEINWTQFNGDFSVPGQGAVFGLRDLTQDPSLRRLTAGYDAYLQALAVVKEVRDRSAHHSRTPLISAGLSDPTPSRAEDPRMRSDAVGIPATIRYLRSRGLDQLVDGYGVHTYVGPGLSAEARREHLRRVVFVECSQARPCWLTEWGLPLPDESCPTPDAPRANLAQDVREDMRPYVDDGVLAALIYYNWSGKNETYSVFRCGQLTDTGRVALKPFSAQGPD